MNMDYNETTHLIEAVKANDIEKVRQLIEDGATDENFDIDEIDYYTRSKTALMWAAGLYSLEIINLLLDNGADIHKRSNHLNETPLLYALKGLHVNNHRARRISPQRKFNVVQCLLERGADSDVWDDNDESSLMYASNGSLIALLVQYGASIHYSNNLNETSFELALRDSDELALLFLRASKNDLEDEEDTTPFIYAARKGDITAMDTLQAFKNIDVNASDNGGSTAMTWAAYEGRIDAVKKLLEYGADINQLDANGDTPLTCAVSNRKTDMVVYLLLNGAELELSDIDGNTPLIIAALNNRDSIVEYLLGQGAKINNTNKTGNTALIEAAYYCHPNVVQFLLEKGATINLKGEKNMSALEWATKVGCTDVVKLLIDYGAK